MTHWSRKYIDLPYQEGVFDCGALCERVQQEVFNRKVIAPKSRDYIQEEGVLARFRAMANQIDRIKHDYAQRTDKPEDGDAILLISRGYMQHLGIYCLIEGESWVLHAASGHKKVVLQRLREMEIRGLKVEGFYKWI